jgi:hypothetical protein
MDDHGFAEGAVLAEQVGAEGHDAARRAGGPLLCHPLHLDSGWLQPTFKAIDAQPFLKEAGFRL